MILKIAKVALFSFLIFQSKASLHQEEGVFKRGFLLTKKEKELKEPEESFPSLKKEISCSVQNIEEHKNMWEDPRYDFKLYPQKLMFPALKMWGKYDDYEQMVKLENLVDSDIKKYFNFLAQCDLLNFSSLDVPSNTREISPSFYAMLILGDKLIKNTLKDNFYLDTTFPNGLLFKGGRESGSINIAGSSSAYVYFSVKDNENKPHYIISHKPYRKCNYLGKSYYLGDMFIPIEQTTSHLKGKIGFFLDEKFSLLPPPAFLVVKWQELDKDFSPNLAPVQYTLDSKTGIPYLLELAPSTKYDIDPDTDKLYLINSKHSMQETNLSDNKDISFFINFLGDTDKLKQDGFLVHQSIFRNLSETSDLITPIEAREILYIGHQILNNMTQEDKELYSQEIDKVKASIDVATQLLLETDYQNAHAQESFAVTADEINEVLKKKVDLKFLPLQGDASKEEKQQRKNKMKKFKKKEKPRVLKDLTVQKKELSKKRIAQKILQDVQEQMQGRHVLKSSEVKEFLGVMAGNFQQHFPVLDITASKARGSHAATEVINIETGASNHISLANRSQGEYKVGTVRKIIYDNWAKLFDLATGNKI